MLWSLAAAVGTCKWGRDMVGGRGDEAVVGVLLFANRAAMVHSGTGLKSLDGEQGPLILLQ